MRIILNEYPLPSSQPVISPKPGLQPGRSGLSLQGFETLLQLEQ